MPYTSPGGRAFGLVAALALGAMALGAGTLSIDAWDGSVAFRTRRGGRVSYSGLFAYLHAAGTSLFSIATAAAALACLAGALGPDRWGPTLLRWLVRAAALGLVGVGLLAAAFLVNLVDRAL